ncbi:uroporphyrinogen-III synthase [Pseudooceanicola sp.]|uniref:uroporphyrinogen-III synthase n=1 Tax=Pseudooceanicola sp. TaxID=1914328 RepID=UPI00261EC54A|nr:uroporphyrinogen-III synthase [Pseudooceanicola sp.]MDF1857022.1 uroporphyrinogen-III synthase [Pseudooceanicola sp.]
MPPVILLTRPAPDAARFADALRARLGEVRIVTSPVMQIDPVGALPDMAAIDGLIFTSRNAVRAYADLHGPARPCYCVGAATADLARDLGLEARAAEGDAASLLEMILRDRPEGRWLHPHGVHLRRNLADELTSAGIPTRGQVVYHQAAQTLNAAARACLTGSDALVLPVFSPRSAQLLTGGETITARLYIVAMSQAVAEAISPLPRTICVIAAHPDADSMLESVVSLWHRAARVEGDGTGA